MWGVAGKHPRHFLGGFALQFLHGLLRIEGDMGRQENLGQGHERMRRRKGLGLHHI